MGSYILFGKEITFSEAADRHYFFRVEMTAAIERAVGAYAHIYRETDNISDVLDGYVEAVTAITEKFAIEPLYAKLADADIFDVSRNEFDDECWDLSGCEEYYDDIVDKYNDIVSELEESREYREMRKASRGRVVGGGFGVGGALKGMAAAGAMNAVSGLGHSIANAVGNARSSAEAASAKRALYNSESTLATLAAGVEDCIKKIFVAYLDFINERIEDSSDSESGYYIDYTVYDDEKGETLLKNAILHPEKREEILIRAIGASPYDCDICEYIFTEYEAERKTILMIADRYHIDMTSCCEELLEGFYGNEAMEDIEKNREAKEKILSVMQEYGIKESDTLDRLEYDALMLIYRSYYKDVLPGKNEDAVKMLREYRAKKSIKADFIKSNEIWELAAEYHVDFEENDKYAIIARVYGKLTASDAGDEHTVAVLDRLLHELGFYATENRLTSKTKEHLFDLLTGVAEAEARTERELTAERKTRASTLAPIVKDTLKGVSSGVLSTALIYNAGELKAAAGKIQYNTIFDDETPLLIYDAKPMLDPLGSGFTLTDKRITGKNKGGGKFDTSVADITELRVQKNIPGHFALFTRAGFYDVDAENVSDTAALVSCLDKLRIKLTEFESEAKKHRENAEEALAVKRIECMEKHTALIGYLCMQKKADDIIAQNISIAKEKEERQAKEAITAIFASCRPDSPNSVADTWLSYLNSGYNAELYSEYTDKLYDRFISMVRNASSEGDFKHLLDAAAKLSSALEEAATDRRQGEFEELKSRFDALEGQIKNAQSVRNIYLACELSDASSLMDAFRQYAESGVPAEEYAVYTNKLDTALEKLISGSETEEELKILLEKINASGVDRLKITYAELIAKRVVEINEAAEWERIGAIYDSCDTADITSVIETWKKYLECGESPEKCSRYISKLDAAAQKIIADAENVVELSRISDTVKAGGTGAQTEHLIAAISKRIAKIKADDEAARTYKGILFDRIEDIAVAKDAELNIEIIMRTVSKDNIESIRSAVCEVEKIESGIKEYYLDILSGYLSEAETKARTYRGIVYDSAEDASLAEREYAEARELMSILDRTDEDAVRRVYEKTASYRHDSAAEFKAQLEALLEEFDVKKRTVDGILFETLDKAELARRELAEINDIMASLRTEDENMLLEAKNKLSACTSGVEKKYLARIEKRLTDYDISCRTYCGKLYDTREEADLLRREEAEISAIMKSVDSKDEESMVKAKENLSHLTTFIKDEAAQRIDNMLREYDIALRTFMGVLYETREEAALVKEEYEIAGEIMAGASPDNEESILNAQREILKLTTAIRDEKYALLKSMWDAYDLRMRTYAGLLFDTREQAAQARLTREEFLGMFDTLDLRQSSNIVLLDNYIDDRLHEKIKPEAAAMMSDLKAVLSEIDSIAAEDAKINITVNKKESAALYKRIEAVLLRMTDYRMNTADMQSLRDKHHASLNVAQKLFSFLKSKM